MHSAGRTSRPADPTPEPERDSPTLKNLMIPTFVLLVATGFASPQQTASTSSGAT